MSIKRTFFGFKAFCDRTGCVEEIDFPIKMKNPFLVWIKGEGWWIRKKHLFKTVCLCPKCKEEFFGTIDNLSKLRDELIIQINQGGNKYD